VVEHVDEILLSLSWSVKTHDGHGSSSLVKSLTMR
jgi:hypothetical protein